MRAGEKDLLEFLGACPPGKTSILTHVGADPDAICSAFAIRHLIRTAYGSAAEIITPGRLSTFNKNLLLRLGIDLSPLELKGSDLIIIVDTPSPMMLGSAAHLVLESGIPLVQIDHHGPNSSMRRIAAVQVIDEEAPSTTEIVYALMKKAGVEIPYNISQAIVTGIVAESSNLSRLRRSSLFILCELSRKGGDIEMALRELRRHPALDERMARLRCAQRLVLARVDDMLISISHVGSYHASAARGLLALGADLAVTVSKDKEGLKITVRATEDYVRRTGIHIGDDICVPLGENLGGEGNGHAGVGGVRASGDLSQVKAKVLSFIEEKTAYALQGSER